MTEATELATLSRFAGQRFDLVQAGGGNTSVKTSAGTFLVKSSGCHLAEVTEHANFAELRLEPVREFLAARVGGPAMAREALEREGAECLEKALLSKGRRPSIETFLHAMGGRVTLHSHPIVVNAICAVPGWEEDLGRLFPDSVLVPYAIPGLSLALELKRRLPDASAPGTAFPAVFLQNHGLIVSGNSVAEVIAGTERICAALERALSVSFDLYAATTRLSGLLESVRPGPWFAVLNTDAIIDGFCAKHAAALFQPAFCPDLVVYLGGPPLKLANLEDPAPIEEYLGRYHEMPRVFLVDGMIYFVSDAFRRIRDIEELLRFKALVVKAGKNRIQPLPPAEVEHLRTWEAEKFRQKV